MSLCHAQDSRNIYLFHELYFFRVDDIAGPCDEMSVPPMCALGVYTRTDNLPEQTSDFDESQPFPMKCPAFDQDLDFSKPNGLSRVLKKNGAQPGKQSELS